MHNTIKKISLFNILYIIIGIPWLFFVIVTSRGFTALKIILLFILIAIALMEIIFKKKKITKSYTLYVVIFIIYCIISLLLGILRGYKFNIYEDFALIQYYIITPLVVILLSSIFKCENNRIKFIFQILKYITLFTVLMDLMKIMSFKGVIPDLDFLNLITIASDITTSQLAVRVSNEASLMFLLPFYFCMLAKSSKNDNKIIYVLICLLGTIYALISGRKMLELVIFFSVLILAIIYLKNIFLHTKIIKFKLHTLILIVISISIALYTLNIFEEVLGVKSILDAAFNTILEGLSSNAYGIIKRTNNMNALIQLWISYPIFGGGLNSYVASSLANSVTLWSYEILYVALLAQIGMIGILLFFYMILYLIKKVYKKYITTGNSLYLSTIFGFASFIICGASNPLVYYIWPWVACIAVLYYNDNISM